MGRYRQQQKRPGCIGTLLGCGLLVVVGLVGLAVLVGVVVSRIPTGTDRQPTGTESTKPTDPAIKASTRERWTKSHRPAWVERQDPEVTKAWEKIMADDNPVFTGFVCTGNEIKAYINRNGWRTLNAFQANNQAMLMSLLPHTDDTRVQFIDDTSGEILADFRMKDKGSDIHVVHP